MKPAWQQHTMTSVSGAALQQPRTTMGGLARRWHRSSPVHPPPVGGTQPVSQHAAHHARRRGEAYPKTQRQLASDSWQSPSCVSQQPTKRGEYIQRSYSDLRGCIAKAEDAQPAR
eukprot:3933510-Rhodomonas_salina.2